MPIPAFPTIALKPSGWSEAIDDTARIAAKAEEGSELARLRARIRHVYVANFTNISEADKETVKTFIETTIGLVGSFTFTHPTTGATLTVKLTATMPQFKYAGMFNGTAHNFDITMRDV